ncbi:MAG: glutamine--tRNA ligase/YqeY domain fusion protein [Eubacteriales bacterium]|jgi:glutaminyl-tRNA synthetase|nr:glutamine--tRNA ligase/YqeY domain fusion protein [Eubacteriales bacterium]NLO12915.1 glutamine--tRNA ligase/YqeY domain fusion protein [Clostridiales bacterium]
MSENLERGNFIWDAIDQDLAEGKYGRVRTRFPPEPNGYLHIGHCKALVTDFGTAEHYGGLCNLRFDDTNPEKEESEFVGGIMEDIRWLGFEWNGGLYFASDYYQQCYDIAEDFIRRGLAYVDELSQEEMREYRGTLTQPGKESPWRERPMAESLDLFRRMKAGEFPEGRYVLRAKIDMASPNINMRDPVMYRILYKEHHRTGSTWCIYPMYDYSHPLGDAIEHISHSLCSLEYEDHRPLYDWVVEQAGFRVPHEDPDGFRTVGPRQIEFARLNITRTVMSKRHLRRLVEEGYVSGWDDPRMPTLIAMRRRGYTPEAIRDFISRVGLAKADSTVEFALLEHCVRGDLGARSPRVMAVLDPLKVVLTNWEEGRTDTLEIENHPDHPEMGFRSLKFSRELYIEREDFMEDPPRKFFRLKPGGEVRLKGAYIIRCDEVVKDDDGHITQLNCTVDMDSRSGSPGADRKVKGTLHWVSMPEAVPLRARLYEPLLAENDDDNEEAGRKDFIARLNPDSLKVKHGCAEPVVLTASVGDTFQFLRVGYFCLDRDSTPTLPVYNLVVGLKDSYRP